MSTWVIIANTSRAQIHFAENNSHLKLIKEFEHPESRMKGIDLMTDGPGHYKTPAATRGSYGGESTRPKEVEAEHFAQQLGHEIDKAIVSDSQDRILLFTDPHFHGLLMKHIHHSRHHHIKHIAKDYTKLPQKELLEMIKPFLTYPDQK